MAHSRPAKVYTVEIKWCSTNNMVADILTKPLGAVEFNRQRARLLGHVRAVDDLITEPVDLQ